MPAQVDRLLTNQRVIALASQEGVQGVGRRLCGPTWAWRAFQNGHAEGSDGLCPDDLINKGFAVGIRVNLRVNNLREKLYPVEYDQQGLFKGDSVVQDNGFLRF